MPYVIMVFLVLMGLGGLKLYNNGDSSGYDRGIKEGLEVDKQELIQLNQDNEILENKLIRERRQRSAAIKGVNDVYAIKLKENRAAHDLALDQYGNTIRVLLNEAQGNREDEANRKREAAISFINGLPGTEGACLSPEARRDTELMSLDANAEAILLELCLATAEEDRK